MTRGHFRFGYWVPVVVLLIGALSLTLLLCVDRLAGVLRNEADIVDAIMDVQINVAATHLWLEHAVHGAAAMETDKITAGVKQAIRLIDATLQGGQAEHDWIAEPIDDPEIRAQTQEIRDLLTTLETLAWERLRNPATSGFGSEIHLRYDAVFKEITTRARALEAAMEQEEVRQVETFQTLFRWVLLIWGVIVVVATVALRRFERQRWIFKEKLLNANQRLLAQTEELTVHREHLADLVAHRTADLQVTHQRLQTEMAERLQASELLRATEEQNRQLSTRLLRAQEIERKRISMGLHDELGQSLSVVKLQLRAIERALDADQETLRADCEQVRSFLDQTIEEVRRLALAMSPTTLEDLGLSAALRWLIGNLSKVPGLAVSSDIAELDQLIPREQWITVYRVVQEILNNVMKHAQAAHLSVIIKRKNHTVDFIFMDDGQGFDPEAISEAEPSARGFGLQTMRERVQMLDGIIMIRSRPGEGTTVTFSIPVTKGGE